MTLALMPEEPSSEMQDAAFTKRKSAYGMLRQNAYHDMRQNAPKLKPLVWDLSTHARTGKAVYITKDPLNNLDVVKPTTVERDKYEADYERRVRELFG